MASMLEETGDEGGIDLSYETMYVSESSWEARSEPLTNEILEGVGAEQQRNFGDANGVLGYDGTSCEQRAISLDVAFPSPSAKRVVGALGVVNVLAREAAEVDGRDVICGAAKGSVIIAACLNRSRLTWLIHESSSSTIRRLKEL